MLVVVSPLTMAIDAVLLLIAVLESERLTTNGLPAPAWSNMASEVVPIPTLPLESIRIRSAPPLANVMAGKLELPPTANPAVAAESLISIFKRPLFAPLVVRKIAIVPSVEFV